MLMRETERDNVRVRERVRASECVRGQDRKREREREREQEREKEREIGRLEVGEKEEKKKRLSTLTKGNCGNLMKSDQVALSLQQAVSK